MEWWSNLKKNKIVKLAFNSYVVILTFFVVWMLFFDENNYLNHLQFDSEIRELKNSIEVYKTKIAEDEAMIKRLQDSMQLEKFAREKYLMKKENEDVFIIEIDTIKK